MHDVIWTCDCGKVEATLPAKGTRLVCYCASCRGFQERLGRTDWLLDAGGSDLYQTAGDQVRLTRGADQLARTKMSPKGPLRWYTTCCSTPMVNTLGTPKLGFASFTARQISPQKSLGKVVYRAFPEGATGPVPKDKGSVLGFLLPMFGRVFTGWITGTWKQNPFFGPDRKPIAPRHDLPPGPAKPG